MELQWVISGQRHHEAPGQVLGQRISMVTEEKAVVAEWGHGNADLSQVIQILQYRSLKKIHKHLALKLWVER